MKTDKLFTGQREMAGLGIYHYGARFYSPKLGRFLSADTIVPGIFNPQTLDRYAYVMNNPLRYVDPTGHRCVETGPGECLNDKGKPINGAGGWKPIKKKPRNNGGGSGGSSGGTPPPITGTPQPQPPATPDLSLATSTPAPPINEPYWIEAYHYSVSNVAAYFVFPGFTIDANPSVGPVDTAPNIKLEIQPGVYITDLPTVKVDLGQGLGYQTIKTLDYRVARKVLDVPGGGQITLDESTAHGIATFTDELILPDRISINITWPSFDFETSVSYP